MTLKSNKNIVTISTPPWYKHQIRVVDLLSDEELAQAKLERPDLIFTLGRDLPEEKPVEESVFNLDNPVGFDVTTMAQPVDLEERIDKLLEKK